MLGPKHPAANPTQTTRHSVTVPSQARRIFAFVAILIVALFSLIPSAEAHRGDQSYLYVNVGTGLEARLQMPFIDVTEVMGIDFSGNAISVAEAIETNSERLADYALEHVQFVGPEGEWTLVPTEVGQVGQAGQFIPYVEVVFALDHPEEFQEFDLRLDPFFGEVENRDALLIVENDLRRGVVDNEDAHLVRFTPDDRSLTVDLGAPLDGRNFNLGLELGIDHIRTGTDHIFFIIALVLPSVLVWRDGWQPTEGFLSSLWKVLKLMTMFTLAHSVTFSLAGLGIVPQPNARVVETAIAVSIVAAAFHNMRPLWTNREWLIAFFFGLFHGFGFASLVQELDVSTRTQLISLVGRNLGIELGQIFVILVLFPMLYLLRRLVVYPAIMMVLSFALAVVGGLWALERISGRESTLPGRLEGWLEYPRVLIFIGIATAIAFLVRFGAERARPAWLDRSLAGS